MNSNDPPKYQFKESQVAGDGCPVCNRPIATSKVFVADAGRADPVAGAMFSLRRDDLHQLVIDAADFLGLEVRGKW